MRALASLLCLAIGHGVLGGCAVASQRAAPSSLGCMQQVRAELPEGIGDRRAHCLAAGGIARRCSVAEAWMAGWGKELRDLFGPGDASSADLGANAAGRRCARELKGGQTLAHCCGNSGY